MATLQNLRNRGPLLIIIVGLALFAFIIGDLWKIFDSSPQDVTIGTVNEDEISAIDYQQQLEKQRLISEQKYSNNSLANHGENIHNEVWNKIILDNELKETAEDMGFGATDNSLINAINSYISGNPKYYSSLFHTIWWGNPELLDAVIVELGKEEEAEVSPELNTFKQAWDITKENLRDEILYRNASDFISSSLITNPTTAQFEYDIMLNTNYDVDVISFPYSEASVSITDEDYAAYFAKNKNSYKNLYNSRDLNIFDVVISPSREDIEYEMSNARQDIEHYKADTTGITQMRGTWDNSNLPIMVQNNVKNIDVNAFPAPYYNGNEQSITIYQLVEKAELPEEIKLSFFTLDATQNSDSIVTLLSNGMSFKEYAETSNMQQGTYALDTTFKYTDMMPVNIFVDMFFKAEANKVIADELPNGSKVIFKITEATNPTTRYKVFSETRTVYPGSKTIDEESAKFHEAIREANNDYKELEKNSYKFNTSTKWFLNYHAASTGIDENIKKWLLDDAKPGEISEVISEGNTMYVVSVAAIHNKGEMTLDELKSTIIPNTNKNLIEDKVANDKYATMVMNEVIKGKTFEQLSSDSSLNVQHYSALNLSTIRENKMHAFIAGMQEGETKTLIGDNGVYFVRLNKINKTTTDQEEIANQAKIYVTNRNMATANFTSDEQAVMYLLEPRNYHDNFTTYYNSVIFKSIVENSNAEDNRYKQN